MSALFNILNTAWCIEDVLCLIATCFPKPPLPSRPESSESSLSFVHSLQLLLVFCCTSLSAGSPFYTIMSLCLESIWIHSLPLHRASRCRMLPAPVIHNRSARWSWLNIQSAYSIHSWVNTAIQSVWACAFASPCVCVRAYIVIGDALFNLRFHSTSVSQLCNGPHDLVSKSCLRSPLRCNNLPFTLRSIHGVRRLQ